MQPVTRPSSFFSRYRAGVRRRRVPPFSIRARSRISQARGPPPHCLYLVLPFFWKMWWVPGYSLNMGPLYASYTPTSMQSPARSSIQWKPSALRFRKIHSRSSCTRLPLIFSQSAARIFLSMVMPFSAMTRLLTAAICPARARVCLFLSRTMTFRPRSAQRAEAARPLMPPPMTTTSVVTVSAMSFSGMGSGGVSQL